MDAPSLQKNRAYVSFFFLVFSRKIRCKYLLFFLDGAIYFTVLIVFTFIYIIWKQIDL